MARVINAVLALLLVALGYGIGYRFGYDSQRQEVNLAYQLVEEYRVESNVSLDLANDILVKLHEVSRERDAIQEDYDLLLERWEHSFGGVR